MKKVINVFFLGILLPFCNLEKVDTSTKYECLLTTSKQTYNIGESPALKVSIKNNSGKDVYLIGSLDGSAHKFRMPFCYFEIEKPIVDSSSSGFHCANVNPLRKEDFILVAKGGTFDPYHNNQYYEILNKGNFMQSGKYQITFHYSTKSSDIDEFFGDKIYGSLPKQYKRPLADLFKSVPSIELESNTIEIEMVEKSSL